MALRVAPAGRETAVNLTAMIPDLVLACDNVSETNLDLSEGPASKFSPSASL